MNKITIEVESDIQEAFEQASEAEKQEIKSLITIFFRESLTSKKLVQVIEEMATKAEAKGLTPEKLADILDSDLQNKSQKITLNAISLDTQNFKFNREDANAR